MQANVKGGEAAARGVAGERLTPLELGAWRGMLRVHAELVRRLDAELQARHGISLTAYEVLMLLADAPRGRMRVSALSASTLLSVSGVSRMIDRLAREGLVVKEACEEDGRGAEVALTNMGRGRVRAARASHLADVRACFLSHLSDEELAALAEVWERVTPQAAGPV
jgi:DNA-binding MarR family transcriptional regulator